MYFEGLANQIKQQPHPYIVFSRENSLFKSSPELGFMVATANKVVTGSFKYRLFLPQATNNHDEELDKLSLITLKPVKIYPFANNCGRKYAYAPIGDDKVLLISKSENSLK